MESIGSVQIITKCTFGKLSDIAFYLLTLVKCHSNIFMSRYVELHILTKLFFLYDMFLVLSQHKSHERSYVFFLFFFGGSFLMPISIATVNHELLLVIAFDRCY